MPYFRTSGNPNDLTLLPEELRDHTDVANIAAAAEADTIDRFTHPVTDPDELAVMLDEGTAVERYVWLKGYAVDPAQAIASLTTALRREIAEVIRWRAARAAKKANLVSETAGNPMTSKQYRDDAEALYPPTFGTALRAFEIRRIYWGT